MRTLNAMTPLGPPPSLIASSVATIQWPIRDESSMPPMNYLNMDEMHKIRSKSEAAANCAPAPTWMNNVPLAISTLFGDNNDTKQNKEDHTTSQLQYDYTILSLAILLLGHDYTDEAHNLVTPYSWPEEIHTSFGPVRYSTSDASVVSYATYIHSLVHRREGWNVGELNMVGFKNADFWENAWSRPVVRQKREELKHVWMDPLKDIRVAVEEIANQNEAGRKWCEENLPELSDSEEDFVVWDPRAMCRLCAQASKNVDDAALVEFVEKVGEAELRVLLSHCLKNAGYLLEENTISSLNDNDRSHDQSTKSDIDGEMALAAANKLSSAHVSAFASDGVVILRSVLGQQFLTNNGEDNCDAHASSIAAGIATRLLDSPACTEVTAPEPEFDTKTRQKIVDDNLIGVFLPVNEESASAHYEICSLFNKGPLSPGDALVVSGDKLLDFINSGDKKTIGIKIYQACSSNDSSATFVNRLHGGRGETPTTVVQWSKGTVHHPSS